MSRYNVSSGNIFGKLTVKYVDDDDGVHCSCKCGGNIVVRKWELFNGKVSCGCAKIKHGLSRSKEYKVWQHIGWFRSREDAISARKAEEDRINFYGSLENG